MGKAKELKVINGRYSGDLDKGTCDKLEKLLDLSKKNGYISDLKNVIYDLPQTSIDMIKESGSNYMVELERGKLEDYQTLGVAYMYFAKKLVLGDSVGMGKTVEVAGLCNLVKEDLNKRGMAFRFLMLTEKTSVPSIRDKMIKFTGDYVEALYGEKRFIENFVNNNIDSVNCSIVGSHSLVNSEIFQQYFISFQEMNGYCPFDILIVDESGDILTNHKTQTYVNAKMISDNFDRVILLNATPFEKALMQFYNQIAFIDDLALPTRANFSKRYEVMQYGVRPYPVPSGKYKNGEEFRDLVSYRYFARTRKSINASMKDCTASLITSELSKIQKQLLRVSSMPHMLYDCPSYFSAFVGYEIETNTETTPKLKDLVELVCGELALEQSILVYARYKEAQDAIVRVLKENKVSVEKMNGETSQDTREALINRFKLRDFRVLVTNVQKGLDFGNCGVCIFYDFDPNPSKMVQFEGRMTRDIDIVDKHVYLLVSKGKELKALRNIIADRAKASDLFTGSDFSCVLSLLMDKDTFANNENG